MNKPGKLTDEEFQIIKGHAMAGANMVEPLLHNENVSPIIRMTYEICRWHHERYDGRGYPDGLKGGRYSPSQCRRCPWPMCMMR